MVRQPTGIPEDFKRLLYQDFVANCRDAMILCSFHEGKLIFKGSYRSREIPDHYPNGLNNNTVYQYYAAIPINSDFIQSEDFHSEFLSYICTSYVYPSKISDFLIDVRIN